MLSACRVRLDACTPRAAKRARLTPPAANSSTHSQQQTSLRDWHDVTEPLLWRGTEKDCLEGSSPTVELPPAWQLMLLSDGSVTRHLQHLSRTPVNVECLQMQQLEGGEDSPLHVPPFCAAIRGPLLQRQVLLRCGEGPSAPPLVYAASWWCSTTVREYLQDDSTPIWVSLSRGHMELYREIQEVQLGHSADLEELLGCPGPFWSRKYFFWNKGRPLTLIHEVFSPRLEVLLGPAS